MKERNEEILAAACSLCRWPEEYKDPDDLWREKCDKCPVEAALNDQWISVNDRLPEDDEHVLAATQNKKGVYNIVKAYYCHHLSCWASGMNSNVTHWMPLPKSPESVE